MKKLLITGFDFFDNQSLNPSWEAVKSLPDVVGEYELHKMQIPTVFAVAVQTVLDRARTLQPDVILCIGQAGGRDAVTPERIAVNIRDARIPDNKGNLYSGQPIVTEGPAAYFSTVPVEKIRDAIKTSAIPAAVSNTAGTFVCNDVLYTLLHHFHGTATQVGFIHVPYLPQQGNPNLPLERTVKALENAIGVL